METRTVTCVAAPTPEQAEALKDTMLAFNAACDYISRAAWEQRVFGQVSLHRLVYREVRARFGLPAQLAVRAIGKVVDAYKSGTKVKAEFRPLGAVVYDCRVLRLLNRSTVSLTTLQGRIKVSLKVGGYQRERLKNATQGETDLLFTPERNRWWFAFSVKSETPPVADPTDCLGVDLGIVNLAVDSDGDVYTGAKVNSLRRRHRRLRARLKQKFTRSAKRRFKQRRLKEQRFARHVNHTISKRLVAKAQRTKRAIVLEDLHGIRDRIRVRRPQRAIFSCWSFYQLRSFVTYKAREEGITLLLADPRNTSRTCPACGHCEAANRPNQCTFRCRSCDFAGLADHIAAVNLREHGRAVVNQPHANAVGLASPQALAEGS
jgi:putative transposase